jgi:hypothetical protein
MQVPNVSSVRIGEAARGTLPLRPNALIENLGQIFNRTFRQVDSAKKCDRQRAGILKGLMVDDARPDMLACFQTNDPGEIEIGQNGSTQCGVSQVCASKVCAA